MKKLISLTFLLYVTCYLAAQSSKEQFVIDPGLQQISLWPNSIPDGPGPGGFEKITTNGSITNVVNARLIIHKPAHPNGTAILIISGGGYAHIEAGKESNPVANWLQTQGVTAFELIYRLPQEGWNSVNVPFEDGQRAMRMIRSMANALGINADKIGILGLSAGGHLAGLIAAAPNRQWYLPVDKIDALSAKPNFAALIYPVISMLPPNNNTHSRRSILGDNPSREKEISYSVERKAGQDMPSTFLAQSIDDPISPIDNSYLLDSALIKLGVPVEMHVFKTGGHGWGMGKNGAEVSAWPGLFKTWANANGFWK